MLVVPSAARPPMTPVVNGAGPVSASLLWAVTGCSAKSRDDFVEYEQSAVRVADLPQREEEPWCWRHQAHVAGNRFDDQCGHHPAVGLKQTLD